MNKDFFLKMPKGELHVHLNGLVSTSIIRELLSEDSDSIPQGFNLQKDLNILKPANSLKEYLKPWEALRLIPKSKLNLKLIVESAFLNLKTDNVQFVELRNSVIYIAKLNNITIKEALNWLVTEIKVASKKFSIKAGLILTFSRGLNLLNNINNLLDAYEQLGCPDIVVGIDLAGNEETPIPNGVGSLFKSAKEYFGLKVTIHAGETGNVNNVLEAVDLFSADRIGHGTAAAFSTKAMELLKERDICIEVCPNSNRLTNAVPENDSHPAIKFMENEVPFVICSDNPAIHNKSLSDDYLSLYNEHRDLCRLEEMFEIQKKYSFLKGL